MERNGIRYYKSVLTAIRATKPLARRDCLHADGVVVYGCDGTPPAGIEGGAWVGITTQGEERLRRWRTNGLIIPKALVFNGDNNIRTL